MENKNEIENMSYSEIKEMINSGKIDLASLDVSVLQGLMDHETDMLCIGEGDVELISRCADVISERETELLSHDEFMSIVHEAADSFVTVPKKAKAKKFSLKRTLIIAASLALLIAACTFAVSTWGFSESGFLRNLIKKPEGTIGEIGGITIQDGGKARTYSTIEEAIEKENLDIMYPTVFPDNIIVESVYITETNGDNKTFYLLTNDINVGFCVEIGTDNPKVDTKDLSVYEINGVKFYTFNDEENTKRYYALHYDDYNSYSIHANNYEELILILNGIKE